MKGLLLMALVLATLAGGATWWPADPPPAPGQAAAPAAGAPALPGRTLAVTGDQAGPARAADGTGPEGADAPPPPANGEGAPVIAAAPRVPPAVAESLSRARRYGDPRTPPLAPPTEPREPPPPEILDDPARYRLYEQGERMAVYASFMAASERKISELETLVARGEREGLPPAQLAEGRRKLEGLKARRRELGERYPELSAPPPDSDGDS